MNYSPFNNILIQLNLQSALGVFVFKQRYILKAPLPTIPMILCPKWDGKGVALGPLNPHLLLAIWYCYIDKKLIANHILFCFV